MKIDQKLFWIKNGFTEWSKHECEISVSNPFY